MEVLQELAVRARMGDEIARAKLRQHLEGTMNRIVRRALRTPAAGSPLTQRIVREAQRVSLAPTGHAAVDREHLIGRVARRMCDAFVGTLRPALETRCRMMDTVRL